MSRSYKKNAYATDGSPKNVRYQKRLANKKVRSSDIPLKGVAIRKLMSPGISTIISLITLGKISRSCYPKTIILVEMILI